MSAIINRRDLQFILYDWLGLGTLFDRPRFAAHDLATVDAVLDLAERVGTELLAPSLRVGDDNEPVIDSDQHVRINAHVQDAVRGIIGTGLFGAAFDEAHGGLQMPFSVYVAAMAILHSASSAATFYMMLTAGNARLIAAGAPRPLFDAFGAPQVAGQALGTMCLSESQAGSSLGDITTKAVADGVDELGERYRIFGNKMWISGADHDVTPNIVHLVLAKVPDDDGRLPEGSRGISLFVVPKLLENGERNDIAISGLNHKMGSRALPNCAVNLGEGAVTPGGAAGAIGWRVGAVGQGLAQMFQMMNEARISVGVASAMTAYRSYLISLDYARERLQGRAPGQAGGSQIPIVRHSDVRRMLLAQKAIAEGALALTLYAARLQDDEDSATEATDHAEAAALLGLLTPIVKSWPAEVGQQSICHAIQILGGAGYTRDFEVELLYRDNRLNSIHEGTTGIQALDLVNRKIRKDSGAAYASLRRRVDETLADAATRTELGPMTAQVEQAWQAIDAAVTRLIRTPDDAGSAIHATAFLSAMGHAVIGWLWLDKAAVSAGMLTTAGNAAERAYLVGKIKAGRYFAEVELPIVPAWLSPLQSDADKIYSIEVEEFLGEAA